MTPLDCFDNTKASSPLQFGQYFGFAGAAEGVRRNLNPRFLPSVPSFVAQEL